MSHITKTKTPFIDKKLLIKALDKLNINYSLEGENIITDRKDFYGYQKFILINGKYLFQHDSSATNSSYGWSGYYGSNWQKQFGDWKSVSEFIKAVTIEYSNQYKILQERIKELERLAEEKKIKEELERLRKEQEEIERKRLELIDNNKKLIKEKAKKMGYKVKETVKNGKVKMVLVRRTY